MPAPRTSVTSVKEKTAVERLYKRTGRRKVSFYYQHQDGRNETLATATPGDRAGIIAAEEVAMRRALDIRQGAIVAGTVADAIKRFREEFDSKHFLSQSNDAKLIRKGEYNNLTKTFGKMPPKDLKMIHGYQYLDVRAKQGAPMKANKEMALMSTMCNYWVRWGIIEVNPFIGLMQNKGDKEVRTITRRQIVQFYLWTQRRTEPHFKVMGCAALFTYLTGFRAAEVRPFHASGITNEGVQVINAKRKKGQAVMTKLRDWSPRLRMVVKRAQQAYPHERMFLFGNRHGKAYTRSGWGSVWLDVMRAWLQCEPADLVKHPMYFSLMDVRPAAITSKITKRSADMYDFAAHANPGTTHRNYDRRKINRAGPTE
jgi:integrase